MADLFAELASRYDGFKDMQDKLENEAVLTEAERLLGDIVQAGETIFAPEQRRILAGLARDLGETIFAISDVYPSVRLETPAGERESIVRTLARSTEEQLAQRNRVAMLQLVETIWVRGVLEKSLRSAILLELGMELKPDAVEHPWDLVLQQTDHPYQALPNGTRLLDVFDEMGGSLLILGEPGSGKTTMLLELAREQIARAKRDVEQPIPVVFNLSSWVAERKPIGEWLVDELRNKYQVPERVARAWLDTDQLVLLLDGLDEVELRHRATCVETINQFLQEHMIGVAVCSRTSDYEVLAIRLRLIGAIVLQPLSLQQIDQYLESVGPELLAARETLQQDVVLQELARSPLMLSIMMVAYRGVSAEELQALDSLEICRQHLFEAYVQRMLERRRGTLTYSHALTIRWLAWLARKMLEHHQVVFLIERMQSSWLQTDSQKRIYAIIALLTSKLIVRPTGHSVTSIEPTEALKWSWRRAARGLRGGLLPGLIGGLVGGIVVGLLHGFPDGLWIGLMLTLTYMLWAGLIYGLNSVEISTRTTPNQGIKQSAVNATVVGSIAGTTAGPMLGLSFGLVFGVTTGVVVGLIGAALAGLIVGFSFGGRAVILHFSLRLMLYRTGCIPWNYVRFLDYASERILLRKVGGGYVFVHKLLQDYFVELDQRECEVMSPLWT